MIFLAQRVPGTWIEYVMIAMQGPSVEGIYARIRVYIIVVTITDTINIIIGGIITS